MIVVSRCVKPARAGSGSCVFSRATGRGVVATQICAWYSASHPGRAGSRRPITRFDQVVSDSMPFVASCQNAASSRHREMMLRAAQAGRFLAGERFEP